MTALSFSRLSFLFRAPQNSEPRVDDAVQIDDAERRRIVGELIAAGACDSEYGVQMMMSIFPDRY